MAHGPYRMMSKRFAILVAVFRVCDSVTALGALKLDDMTFDKFINDSGFNVLVKFDSSHPYGPKEDAFKEVCRQGFATTDFLAAEVPVQEVGIENQILAETFGVTKEDFPVFYIFKGSTESYVKFEGRPNPTVTKPEAWDDEDDGEWEPPLDKEITADSLIWWLRTNEIRIPYPGTITEFNEVAKRFMTEGMRDSDLDAAKALAAGPYKDDGKASIYVQIMQKVKAKGASYIQKEINRILKLDDNEVTEEQREKLIEKFHILQKVFLHPEL